jgi:hypothetical protein
MIVTKLWCVLGLSILLLAGPLAGQAGADPIPSDFDGDGDVDLADFAEFQTCVLGPDFPQTDPLCADARLDADPDVDLDDFAVLLSCFGGPASPADPSCACLSGETSCDGTCTSTAGDNANCGYCGNVCWPCTVCMEGICMPFDFCGPGTMCTVDGCAPCDPGDIYSPCYCGPEHPNYPDCN